jgi:hypothetical protein
LKIALLGAFEESFLVTDIDRVTETLQLIDAKPQASTNEENASNIVAKGTNEPFKFHQRHTTYFISPKIFI